MMNQIEVPFFPKTLKGHGSSDAAFMSSFSAGKWTPSELIVEPQQKSV